jgi:hypothetical protein
MKLHWPVNNVDGYLWILVKLSATTSGSSVAIYNGLIYELSTYTPNPSRCPVTRKRLSTSYGYK